MDEGDVRTHIVLPARLVRDIDELVGRRKRSQFLTRLAVEEIKRLKLLAAARAAAGSLTDEDVPEWSTPEQAYAWVRELRAEGEGDRDRRLWGDDWADGAVDDTGEETEE